MDTFAENDKQIKEKGNSSTLVSNGTVGYHSRIADKRTTGGWKPCPFITIYSEEVVEMLAFHAILVNMTSYLVGEMHEPVTNWSGAAHILAILGAFLADAYIWVDSRHS